MRRSAIGSPARRRCRCGNGRPLRRWPGSSPLRRFALVAGSNDGGAARVRLRYAATDAQAMARVLQELGGVRAEDLVMLVDPDLSAFTAALARMRQRCRRPGPQGERREIVFYYSGHSDERGLILGSDVYPYDELRAGPRARPGRRARRHPRLVLLRGPHPGEGRRRGGPPSCSTPRRT